MTKLKIAVITINKPSLASAQKLNSYLDDFDVEIYIHLKKLLF
jgi:hypothetical protein